MRMWKIVVGIALLWILVASSHSYNNNKHELLHRRLLRSPVTRRQLESSTTTTTYFVTLHLALQYMNDSGAAQLESLDPSNELVQGLCSAVNEQAGGQQVEVASSALNVSVTTRVDVNNSDSGLVDYGCTLLATTRHYDSEAVDIFGPGFFELQVSVQQAVDVSPATLSQQTVTDLVQTGFDQGTGGRVRFRGLLVRSDDRFDTILNVQLIYNLSAPQSAPTFAPSPLPTRRPTSTPTARPTSGAPSMQPSLEPSRVPSILPFSDPPTAAPISPSQKPSVVVSSPRPSVRPSAAPHQESPAAYNRQPLILGAIAGGVATIMVSCFFIFCVWYPFCHVPKTDGDSNTPPPASDALDQSRRCRSSSLSPSALRGQGSIVPDIVQLDDENASLADTSLGDHTAFGEMRRQPVVKKLIVRDPSKTVHTFDSFDESSIYTSGLGNENPLPKAPTMMLPPSLSRTLEYEEDIVFPVSGSASDSQSSTEGQVMFAGSKHVVDDGDSMLHSLNDLKASSSDSSSSAFEGVETAASDEERAKTIARSMDSGTKGFDPFAGDSSNSSSFDFGSETSEGIGENIRTDRAVQDLVTAPSASSALTEQVVNRQRSPRITDRQDTVHPSEEEKRDIDDELREGSDSPGRLLGPPSPARAPDSLVIGTSSRPDLDANNSLLRAVLEDARRLAASKHSPSSRSRQSKLSAPSRLAKWNPTSLKEIASPDDLLVDNHDLDHHISLSNRNVQRPKASSKSVGAILRRDEGIKGRKESSGETPPYRTRFLERGASVRLHHFVPSQSTPTSTKETLKVEGNASSRRSSSPEIQRHLSMDESSRSFEGTGTLGAERRVDEYETARNVLSETPASSPGVLGISSAPLPNDRPHDDLSSGSEGLSNPFLFDLIEQQLGPRSPAADMESISGKSNRSGKSQKSSRSQHTYGSRTSTGTSKVVRQRPGPQESSRTSRSYGSRPSTAVAMIDGSVGEQKSASESSITPRSLEYDLKRLEVQLADSLHAQFDLQTASSITGSSAGASKSTRSSKHARSLRQQIHVVVPPGKLGVVLADRHDGEGTVVSEVRSSSAITGMLRPGDRLVAIDGEDVTRMVVSQITSLMASKIHQERRLTLVASRFVDVQEAKVETDK